MFRSLLKNKQFIANKFSNHKSPLIIANSTFSSKFESEKKLTPVWKATKGNGKSIFDCENESWCKPQGEKLSRTYKKKLVSIENEHLETVWIEVNKRED